MRSRNKPLARILAFTTPGFALVGKIAAGALLLAVYAVLAVMLLGAFIRGVEYILRVVN